MGSTKQFYLDCDGIKLNVNLDMPEVCGDAENMWDAAGVAKNTVGLMGKKIPLCIVIHGFTGHSEEVHIRAVAKAMNDLGVATLRADMYGHGHSDGKFEDHTLYKWLTNIMTVVDYAKSLDFVSDIYMMGHSQGGLAVMLAAAMERDVIKALIPLSPATMIPEIARAGSVLGIEFDPVNVPDVLQGWDGLQLKGNYVRVAQTIDVEAAIKRYHHPVLIIHGTEDEAVPYEYSVKYVKEYSDGRLVSIEGDDHCYNKHLEQVVDAVKDFMVEQLGK